MPLWAHQTHASTTDLQAKLCRKANGWSSRMAFMGHVLMENRSLVVGRHGQARGRITLGADKGCDVREFVREVFPAC